MSTHTLDLCIFALGNMIAVIILSILLWNLGWIGFLALWLTIHCGLCLWSAWHLLFGKDEIPRPLDYHGYGD